MQSGERFSNRADDYARFRPGYPPECIEFLHNTFGITKHSLVADIGSGTGILTRLLLGYKCKVFAVEPNDNMRRTAEQLLKSDTNFVSVHGSGEATHLDDHSIDVITVAQAFHWLDPVKAKQEFLRVLQQDGDIAILWNIQAADSKFATGYESIKEKYGKDYIAIRKSHQPDLAGFFSPRQYRVMKFPHHVILDIQGLKGLIQSSSFMPRPSERGYAEMTKELDELFAHHQENGLIRINYETHVHYGV